MNYKKAIEEVYSRHRDHFQKLGITKGMAISMWKIYYDSLVSEVYNPDRDKVFINQPNIGLFKHGISGYQEVVQNWRKHMSKANMLKLMRKGEDPENVINDFRTSGFPFVKKEVDVIENYTDAYEIYNRDLSPYKDALSPARFVGLQYWKMNDYLDKSWHQLKLAKKRLNKIKNSEEYKQLNPELITSLTQTTNNNEL